jgi:hypothetical protein
MRSQIINLPIKQSEAPTRRAHTEPFDTSAQHNILSGHLHHHRARRAIDSYWSLHLLVILR